MVEGGGLENRYSELSGSWVRIPPSPPVRYIPGTSFTVHSEHMIYTMAYLIP